MSINREKFLATIKDMGDKLLRLKGNINFDGSREFVEIVFDDIEIKPANEQLGDNTAFTAIAWNTEKEQLARLFQSCINE